MPVVASVRALREQWLCGEPVGRRLRRISLGLLVVVSVLAGTLVFSPGAPAPRGQSALHHWAAIWRLGGTAPTFLTFETVEWGANVVMFLPIGFLLAAVLSPGSRHRVVPIAAAGSVVIELVQLFIPERVSSLSDVLANTVGAVVGVLLLVRLTGSERVRRHRLRRPPGGADGPC